MLLIIWLFGHRAGACVRRLGGMGLGYNLACHGVIFGMSGGEVYRLDLYPLLTRLVGEVIGYDRKHRDHFNRGSCLSDIC